MKPIDFQQSTKVLSESGCGELPVWCDGKQCVSCWKPSIKERIAILFGGNVWLGVMSGKTQPPVFVTGERVFEKAPIKAQIKAFLLEVITDTWKSVVETVKMPNKRKCLKARKYNAL